MRDSSRLVALLLSGGMAALAVSCGGTTAGTSHRQAQSQPSPKESKKASHGFHPQPISGTVPCKPHGTSLTMTAKPTLKFSKNCLAAPANERFTIRFANYDKAFTGMTALHNIAIYSNSSAQHNVFNGKVIQPQEKVTYQVKALPRGIYYFKCIVDANMNGTFVSY